MSMNFRHWRARKFATYHPTTHFLARQCRKFVYSIDRHSPRTGPNSIFFVNTNPCTTEVIAGQVSTLQVLGRPVPKLGPKIILTY